MVLEHIHTSPIEVIGFNENMKLNWNFQKGGGGSKPKKPPWEGYGYFLETLGKN